METSMKPSKGPAAPRGRRERPCDACRKRKSKCVVNDGQKICAACGVHGQECTYVEDPQPRKRKLDGEGKEVDATKRRFATPSQEGTENRTIIKRENSNAQPKLEQTPSTRSSQNPTSVKSQHYGTHIGPTTELEPILLDLSSSKDSSIFGSSYQKPDGRTAFLVDKSSTETVYAANSPALQAVVRLAGAQGPPLVQIYKTVVHPSFRIIEDSLLQELEAGQWSSADPVLLCALYCLAATWLRSGTPTSAGSPVDAVQLEDLAFRLFGESLRRPLLSTVQAGLLLMQKSTIDTKSLNTQLVGVAHELGLHLDCSTWTINAAEKGLRKRLAWALYMQDKWCALIHGRPSAIFSTNWDVRPLNDGDFAPVPSISPGSQPSLADFEQGQALFGQMASLTELLSNILDTFFTLQAMREIHDAGQEGTRLILKRAKPVQMSLKDWFTRIPPNLKLDSNMTGTPSSAGYLHLAYFATEITLHRCIIRSLESSNQDPYLAHICRSAAKTRLISAMDFVNRLKKDHLRSFWYFPSKINFALIGTFGSLLLATAPCQEEADFYRTRLAEYRWTLTVSSRTADFLSFAVDSLDSSSTLLQNMPKKPLTKDVSAQFSAARAIQNLSPPQDELMTDAPPSMHLGHLPGMESANLSSATASGLASPSTSVSSDSPTYEAYVGSFTGNRAMDLT